MPRKEEEKVVRHHMHIYERDWERLQTLFGSTLGISKAVRTILRQFLDKAEAKAASSGKFRSMTDHDISDLTSPPAAAPNDKPTD